MEKKRFYSLSIVYGVYSRVDRQRSERFSQVEVDRTCNENSISGTTPYVEWVTEIRIQAKAVARAHWTFDQPTRGGMKSHLTYNEYPLDVVKLG